MDDTSQALLLPHHAALIHSSGISTEVTVQRGYRSIKSSAELERLGFSARQRGVPALLIPIYNIHGDLVLYQSRPDTARMKDGKFIKYETPAKSRMCIDVHPSTRERLKDPAWPLFITEGVRKADSAVSHGLVCIALLGVWNWRGTNELGGKAALPDWEAIALNGRLIYIVFDSDVMTKPAVHAALLRLKAFLETRQAKVRLVYLPDSDDGRKVGLDDFLGAGHDVSELEVLSTDEVRPLEVGDDGDAEMQKYRVDRGRICVKRTAFDTEYWYPLCNFTAFVSEELELDDGVDISRSFMVEGTLDSGLALPPVRVAADQFSSLLWVPKGWGLRAVVSSGLATRDQLREAIQRLSPGARYRRVYTHTGWRKIDGRWAYLFHGGAIGAGDVDVELPPELARYSLPDAPDNAIEAMHRSLHLLRVAPMRVTGPLWAATFRAALASVFRVDCCVWLEGKTGSLKSTLAALFQSHFGHFERLTLPGDWRSTANLLEKRAFTLKDALFVIDEYVPNQERKEFEQKAVRVIRAQGNLSGRGRLRADLTERGSYPPRGLILGTGEEHPPGQSIMARTLVLELRRDEVRLDLLSDAQAQVGMLPHAMASFISWLAPQIDALAESLPTTFNRIRAKAGEYGHLRVPEVLAQLGLGLDIGLAYACDVGAITDSERGELQAEGWASLVEAARSQGQLIQQEQPVRRFLEIINTLLLQGKALLMPKEGNLSAAGSDEVPIGWQDADYLYLLPEAAYQVASRFCRDAGEQFPISKSRLMVDLAQEKLTKCSAGRNTATVRLAGSLRRVLMVRRRVMDEWIGAGDAEQPLHETAETDETALRG